MDTSVETLEANKVKLHVAVPAAEFETGGRRCVPQARATRCASPGFRPGKAPRRILEARFGVRGRDASRR